MQILDGIFEKALGSVGNYAHNRVRGLRIDRDCARGCAGLRAPPHAPFPLAALFLSRHLTPRNWDTD